VAYVADLGELFGKAIEGVPRHEPGCFDVVLVPKLEESVDADGCTKDAA
jgi:hypothetical protein